MTRWTDHHHHLVIDAIHLFHPSRQVSALEIDVPCRGGVKRRASAA